MTAPEERITSLQLLAAELRTLHKAAGFPSYRELSKRTNYSTSTLHAALEGQRLPSWELVHAYVVAFGGKPENFRELWQRARAEAAPTSAATSKPLDDQETRIESSATGAYVAYELESTSATRENPPRTSSSRSGRVAFAMGALGVSISVLTLALSETRQPVSSFGFALLTILLGVALFFLGAMAFRGIKTLGRRLLELKSSRLANLPEYGDQELNELPARTIVESHRPIAGSFEVELPTELLGRRTPLLPSIGGLVGLLSGGAAIYELGPSLATSAFFAVFVVCGVGGLLYGLYLFRDRRLVLDAVQNLLDSYRVSGSSKIQHHRTTDARDILREQLFALRRSGDNRLAAKILDVLDPPSTAAASKARS